MNPSWFYCEQVAGGIVTLSERESRHARQSRRLRPGDPLVLFDGQGVMAHGNMRPDEPRAQAGRRSGKQAAPVSVAVSELETQSLPTWPLTLIVAGCKGARLDWLVEKCTELGAARMILTEFERSVVHTGPQHADKLKRTAIEACKQCGRAWLPKIEVGVSLHEALACCAGSTLLAAHLSHDAIPLADVLAKLLQSGSPDGAIAVVIGPEGGLAPSELGWFDDAGGQLVRLGPLVLRVETAAVAVTANWAATRRIPED